MKAFQIQDTKDFMKKLLLTEDFDLLCVSEAVITTYCTFSVNGSYFPEYFSGQDMNDDDPSSRRKFASWKQIRPFFLELTKGKNTPLSFRIVFRFSEEQTEKWILQSGLPVRPGDVGGLFLTVRFANRQLSCTSGLSLTTFSLDRSAEQAWDTSVASFLRKLAIPFE